ncbi:hypothetical protein [Synechocystis sp. PCC 7338]|uniref:hypothetical protein n=1 Tax=Synechocystis sp. PCC 7338 TaxID=2732530 RepID=UPI001BAFAF1F|nr:hypothetical protein [Synechocystis sp. PCC 7338]QUS60130.1 hypothetical protein HTZ78_05230 [Synechocystis sp. PCC 7338]
MHWQGSASEANLLKNLLRKTSTAIAFGSQSITILLGIEMKETGRITNKVFRPVNFSFAQTVMTWAWE